MNGTILAHLPSILWISSACYPPRLTQIDLNIFYSQEKNWAWH